MADLPARGLVIYGDAVLPALTPHHSHIHAFAASGCCGFLALRDLDPSVTGAHRVVAELAQLLDVYDFYTFEVRREDCRNKSDTSSCMPSMSDRFMGLKAAMFTNSRSAGSLGKKAGFTVSFLDYEDGIKTSAATNLPNMLPDPTFMASKLLNLLGFDEGRKQLQAKEAISKYELLLLHVLAEEENSAAIVPNIQTESNQDTLFNQNAGQLPTKVEVADWLDMLLANIKCLSSPGSNAAKQCYMSLVLGYGTVGSQDQYSDNYPSLEAPSAISPELLHLRPRQSYLMKGGQLVIGVRSSYPLLVVCQQEAVTRCDLCKAFDFNEFQEHSGNLAILVDRFLHEVAFKLWKAPKYGA